MQWKEENRALFAACLNGLEDEPMVRAMDAIPQHVKGVSCYDHCLFVAYVGFTLCRIFGLDYRAAARAGLLHDLYLQKWEETDVGRFRRLVIHFRSVQRKPLRSATTEALFGRSSAQFA